MDYPMRTLPRLQRDRGSYVWKAPALGVRKKPDALHLRAVRGEVGIGQCERNLHVVEHRRLVLCDACICGRVAECTAIDREREHARFGMAQVTLFPDVLQLAQLFRAEN